MILRVLLLTLILGGLGGFGAVAWVMLPHSSPAAAAGPPAVKVAVLTIAHSLRAGALLKPEDLTASAVLADKVPPGAVLDEGDAKRALVGGLLRRTLAPGDILRLPDDALRPSDHGFLAAVLAPGMRAVTVGVDMISGAAGLIWPGDRVDLILTQAIEDQGLAPGRRVAAETVLHDVRVIAIDQQLGQGGDTTNVAKTVTLEVGAAKAELIQVATKLGRLSLALRSANPAPAETATAGTVWAGDVSPALNTQPTRTAISVVRVFQGGADGKEFKF